MLKEHRYIFKKLNVILDILIVGVTFWCAHFFRNQILSTYIAPLVVPYRYFSDYSLYLFAFLPVFILCLEFNRYYSSQRTKSLFEVAKIIFLSVAEATLITFAFLFFVNKMAINRPQIAIFAPAVSFAILLKTYIIRRILVRLREKGYNFRTLVLVGSGDGLKDFVSTVETHPFWGFKIVGIISDDPKIEVGRECFGHEIVETLDGVVQYLFANPVDNVIFVPGNMKMGELRGILEECEVMGIKTSISLNFFDHSTAYPSTDKFEHIPVMTYNPTREMSYSLLFKYMFDRIAAFVLLVLFSPVMILTAILIKILPRSRGGPVFYKQIRSGLYGKTFTLYKFRSMVLDADKKLAKLMEHNEMVGPVFKIKNDPRVTPLGRFIRKTSIDELPQLINVLRGEMSLVGPRPPIPEEVLKYDRWQRRRLSMKPGITCLWQVMGRNTISFETWMKLDLEYIDNWSLILDFKILFRTVYVVATGHGAM